MTVSFWSEKAHANLAGSPIRAWAHLAMQRPCLELPVLMEDEPLCEKPEPPAPWSCSPMMGRIGMNVHTGSSCVCLTGFSSDRQPGPSHCRLQTQRGLRSSSSSPPPWLKHSNKQNYSNTITRKRSLYVIPSSICQRKCAQCFRPTSLT